MNNIACALRACGHEAELINLTDDYQGCDWLIIQSEWADMDDNAKMPNYRDFKRGGGKSIVLLGHFIKHVYPDPKNVQADVLVTVWSGECVSDFPEAKFFPHGYSEENDLEGVTNLGDVVWAGNSYPLRKEDWFSGLEITRISGILPRNLPAIYRGANVAVSLHGDFQKNIVSNEPSRIADKPGTMINERFWQLLGCGALMVTDWTPQMERFFSKDDLIVGETKEEFQELVKYYSVHREEGLNKLAKARELVRENHSYRHRCERLLEWLK